MSEPCQSRVPWRIVVLGAIGLSAHACTGSGVVGEACDLLPGDLVISEVMPNPVVDCDPYDAELACEDVAGCNWSDSCRNIESCRTQGDEPACGSAPGCAWVADCIDTCSSHTIAGACGARVQDRVVCEAALGCAWDANDERCRSSLACDSRADQPTCEQLLGCEWSTGCLGTCGRHEKAAAAVSASACNEELGCTAPDCQPAADGCSLAACEDVAGCSFHEECKTSDDDREWFEVYNASSQTQPLSRTVISLTQTCEDGTVRRREHGVRGDVSVAPDQYFVFGNGAVGVAPIDYSYDPALNVLGLGKDLGDMSNITSTYATAGIEIECGDRLIDSVLYGVGGAAPVPTEGYSLTFSGDLAPDAILNDREDYWCSGGDTFDEQGNVGSPGGANVPCGLVRCQENGVFRDAVPPAIGEIVVSEVLMDPSVPGSGDTHNYWFEIYIAGDHAVDLRGLGIATQGGGAPPDIARIDAGVTGGVIDETGCVTAQPGQYVVIGETANPGDNDNLVVDAVAPGLRFSTPFKDNGGVIAIGRFDLDTAAEIIVDLAALPARLGDESGRSPRACIGGDSDGLYDDQSKCECTRSSTGVLDCAKQTGCTWNAASGLCEGGVKKYSGRTLALDGPVLGLAGVSVADLNDASAAFCYSPDDATGHFGGVGTPGLPNDPCGTVACVTNLGEVRAALQPPAQGLVISEVYPNPNGADVNKEWLELYVATGRVDSTGADIGFDLNGISVASNKTGAKPSVALIKSLDCVHGAAGDFMLVSIYNEADASTVTSAENGGVVPDAIATITGSGFFTNVDSSDPGTPMLHVEAGWGGVLYDATDVLGPSEGVSAMLAPQQLSVLGNNDPAAFCEPVVKFPSTFEGEGTPGARNVCGPGCADVVGGPPRESAAPGPGDVVITEIDADLPLGYTYPPPYPQPAAGSDLGRDWLEVYSTASAAWDLNALTVSSTLVSSGSTRSFSVVAPLCVSVAPGTYAVLGGPEAASRDGVPADATLNGSSTVSVLHEGPMTMALEANGVPIDQAASVNPDFNGSWSLNLASITGGATEVANDDIANWCIAPSQINWSPPHAATGSPGAANEVCPPCPPGCPCAPECQCSQVCP